ncbi:hypothetical protein ACRSCC_006114 [Pseudomonas aeruginosa]
MTESKICTCPSGDGSLVHPCPAHPAVEQVGGDERAAFELFVRKHCGMPAHIAVNWDAKFTNDAWEGWQARAALAQRSEFHQHLKECADEVATWPSYKREALTQPSPAQAEQAEAERPEVFGLERYRVERTGQGFWPYCVRAGDGTRELFVGHLKQCKRVAAQLATAFEDGKFVAGALRAENAKLIEALDESDGDRWRLRSERDAALARVAALESKLAELEKQEPVAWGAFHFGGKRDGKLYTHCETEAQIEEYILDMHRSSDSLTLRKGPLYGAPVAQAGQVPQAWLDVQAERRRQVEAEGWTPEHDDLYCAAELPRAAAAYILNGANDEAPAIWPFSAKWWKPSTARRDMVKACALALAEIERLDRAAHGKEGNDD